MVDPVDLPTATEGGMVRDGDMVDEGGVEDPMYGEISSSDFMIFRRRDCIFFDS